MLPIKSIRSSRLAGQREHLYECIVLLFRRLAEGPGVAHGTKKLCKKISISFCLCHPPATHECLQKKVFPHSVKPFGRPEGTYT